MLPICSGFSLLTVEEKKIIRSTGITSEKLGKSSNDFEKNRMENEIKRAYSETQKQINDTIKIGGQNESR